MTKLFNFEDEKLNEGFQIDMSLLAEEKRQHVLQMFEARGIKWNFGENATAFKPMQLGYYLRFSVTDNCIGFCSLPYPTTIFNEDLPLINYATLCRGAVQLEPNVFSEMPANRAFELEDYAGYIEALGSFNGCTLFRSVGGMVYKNTFNETLPTISPEDFEQKLKGIYPVIKDYLTTEKPKYLKAINSDMIVEVTDINGATFSGNIVHGTLPDINIGEYNGYFIRNMFEPCDYTPNEVLPETEQPKPTTEHIADYIVDLIAKNIELKQETDSLIKFKQSSLVSEQNNKARIVELEAQLAAKNEPSTEPNDSVYPAYSNGLTKREYYTGLAMQGLLANSYSNGVRQPAAELTPHELAEYAVKCADAAIDILNGKKLPESISYDPSSEILNPKQ